MGNEDLSLWHETNGSYYTDLINGWYTYAVYQRGDSGLWYWHEKHHDGWDGSQVVDEITDESEREFSTWQEAAVDCETESNMLRRS